MKIATLSVIHNAALTIDYMLRSLAWVDLIIIYNDKSTDGTIVRINKYKGKTNQEIIIKDTPFPKKMFEEGELKVRNTILKQTFKDYDFDFLILIDGDELFSVKLKNKLLEIENSHFDSIALTTNHIYDNDYYLHFYESNFNGTILADPHVRVLKEFKKYEKGSWKDIAHPWIPWNQDTLPLDGPFHYHLKYIKNLHLVNTSLPFLSKTPTVSELNRVLRKHRYPIPLDVKEIISNIL